MFAHSAFWVVSISAAPHKASGMVQVQLGEALNGAKHTLTLSLQHTPIDTLCPLCDPSLCAQGAPRGAGAAG